MQKLRIGFVVNNLIVGGVSKVLISLCNSLDINKYDIYIFILSNDTQMEKYIQLNSNVNRYIFNYSFKNSYTSISYLKSAFLKSDTKIRAKKIIEGITKLNLDVLHFHTLPRQLPIGQLILKKNPKIKLIFTDHSVRISAIEYKTHQKFLLKIAYSRFYKNFNIIAVSKKVYNSITQNNLNDASKKIKILENSISISDYNRTKKIDTNSFIYISRITDQKGHRTLINAWKSIKNKEKGTLYIIGPDESNGAIIQLAKNDKTIVLQVAFQI